MSGVKRKTKAQKKAHTFNLDKKTLIIIISIMAVIWLMSAGTAGILDIVLSIPGVIIAMTFHEFAHAYAAVKLRR